MSDETKRKPDEANVKHLDGSHEELRSMLNAALAESGLFADAWVRDTFDDRIVVTSWPPEGVSGGRRYFELTYTATDDGFDFGEPEEVEIETTEEAVPKGVDFAERGEKQFRLEVKELDLDVEVEGVKGWTFDGYASVFDVIDYENDVVRKGAFLQTIAEDGPPNVKDHHGPTVGRCIEAGEDDHGLLIKAFIPNDPKTDFLRKLMKIGAVAEMSFGWAPYVGGVKRLASGVRELTAIKLFEVSAVTKGMNPATAITAVKSAEELAAMPTADLANHAAEILVTATEGAKALAERRSGDNRDLSARTRVAIYGLAAIAEDQAKALRDVLNDASTEVEGNPAAESDELDDSPEPDGAEALQMQTDWLRQGFARHAPGADVASPTEG